MAMVEVGSRFPTAYERRGSRGGVRARGNDILFARITPCLENGKLAQLPTDAPPTGGSTEFIVVRPGPEVDPGFVYYWCMSPDVRKRAEAMMSGTTGRMRLSGNDLANLQVGYPPLDEQRRIVDLLEDHLSRLDAAGSYLSSAASSQELLFEELLHSALAGVKVENVPFATVLQEGLTNGRSVPTRAGGFPVLRLTALRDGRVDLRERKEGAWGQSDAERFLVEEGDFLIARGNGSIRLVGLGGLVVDRPDPVAYPDTLIRARPDHRRLAPAFLSLVWNSRIVRKQIEGSARTTAGIYKVNQKDLGAVVIPVPSLGDQAAIVANVQKSREALCQLAFAEGRARNRLAALRRSLLTAAFAGHLSKASDA